MLEGRKRWCERKSLASDVQKQTDASVELKTTVERKAEVDALLEVVASGGDERQGRFYSA